MKAKIFVGPAYSGKTRTAQMISEYIGKDKSVFISGRGLVNYSPFGLEAINSNTELLIIDDCPINFSFEKFYDVNINEKGEIIDYSISVNKRAFVPIIYKIPKIIFTTNFSPTNKGESFNRRFEIIEFPTCDLLKIKSEE